LAPVRNTLIWVDWSHQLKIKIEVDLPVLHSTMAMESAKYQYPISRKSMEESWQIGTKKLCQCLRKARQELHNIFKMYWPLRPLSLKTSWMIILLFKILNNSIRLIILWWKLWNF